MKSKRNTVLAAVLSMGLLAACSGGSEVQPESAGEAPPVPSASAEGNAARSERSGQQSREQAALESFIHTKLTGPHGVFTNLLETRQEGEAATGHEVLSESASILMRYAVLTGNEEQFAEQWKLARQTFDMEDGFSYRYSPLLKKRYPVNAAVDDLRLIRALYEAGEQFKNPAYTEEADRYGQRFYEHNVKDGEMYDFFDENYQITNAFITLCYIDLSTLQKLSIPIESRDTLTRHLKGVLEKGYLSDVFPLYETRFHYESGAYSSENINTVESLLTILHLAEVQQQAPASIAYIKQQVEAGTLYGQYTKEGRPTTDVRSTAIYALTAMIGAETGDNELYNTSIARMNEFRVTDAGSELYGGFGDVGSMQAYSFDNLMALLAYAY
ncbi:hypothetical protein GCM10010912_42910 [Paenibacillus albidus]|uniref:Glycosyl hydrolase n=1 Tax=Paenibacillus albidus TaxID=2041023 RepID=A0A917FNP5_9BACL|nr:hypothetical protein [Paenibacillus albidus]GGF93364.1 hypothetical protein GCM10010912_42910 [Paenibacillus albidus]